MPVPKKKSSMCTGGTRGGSETSLNRAVYENVKTMYEPLCEIIFGISLNFFKNCPRLMYFFKNLFLSYFYKNLLL